MLYLPRNNLPRSNLSFYPLPTSNIIGHEIG